MSASFAAGAARLAGAAGALLGWRPADFWAATPVELATILEALAGESAARADGADIVRLRELFPDG